MKRIISFVLCLSMLISTLPVNVFAAAVDESTPVTEAAQEPVSAVATEAPVAETTEAAETTAEETTAGTTEAPETTAATEPSEEEVSEPAPTENEAAEPEETVAEETDTETTFTWIPDMELPSDEELFAGYVEKTLYGGVSVLGTAAGDMLSGDTKLAYDAFRTLILEIASGERDSAEMTVGAGADADLSVNFSGTVIPDGLLNDLFYALLADLPYEMYWFDKTAGVGGAYGTSGGKLYIKLRFRVSADYSADGSEETYDLDTGKTGAAAAAAANAQAVVDAYADASDYEKLVAYRDEICLMTAYNNAAANSSTRSYGDPWQLIWVFDGLDSTKVVCEGYAKAFQYLCDLSDFDADITCYSVQGYMAGGGHMWNVVSINGSSYLVDVTNSELGTAGYGGKLFLVGAAANADGSYTFVNKKFVYNDETIALWGSGEDSILTLATANFDPDSLNVSAPEADTVVSMSQEDFETALAECGGYCVLSETVVISSDMTIPEVRIEIQGGTIIVEEGVTLTNSGGIVIQNEGSVIVNGTLDNSGWYLDVEDGGSLTVNGTLTGNDMQIYGGSLTNNGTLDINQVNVGVLTLDKITLTGVPEEKINYAAAPTTTDELIAALALVEQYNPWIGLQEDLTLDKNVTIPEGANVAFENATLTVASGVTLTLDGEFIVHPNSHLVVAEGGKLVNNVNMTITNHSSHENGAVVTIDGELVSNGGIWIADGGTLNVNGTAVAYEAVHAGFGGNGLMCPVNVSGSLTTYGYLNIAEATSELNIAEGGTVTVGGYLFDDEGNPCANGYLQAGGNVNVSGTLNLDGGFTLGCENHTSELNVAESGVVNVPQGNLWCDIPETGLVSNEGTVNNDGIINVYNGTISNFATFNNNGQIRLFGTGTYDDYNDAVIAGNQPCDGPTAQLNDFLYDLEDGYGANLYNNVTLAEDLTIDLGTDNHLIIWDGAELHIPDGVTLTIDSHVAVNDGAIIVEEGGTLIVNTNVDFNAINAVMGCLIVNGHMTVNDGGTLWISNGALLEINGTAEVLDDSATEGVSAAVHVGFGVNGQTSRVNINGTLSTGGYLNITPNGWLNLGEAGTLNILNTEEAGCGYLDVTGMAQLRGTVNLDGLLSSSNGNENGEYKDATARIEVYGTLNASDTSTIFINPNASISVTGTMETAGEVIVEDSGALWVDGDVTLSGPVTNYGFVHVNYFTADSGNDAELVIDGEMTTYGYLAVHNSGTLYVNGTLNISQTMVEDQGYAGYLNSFGYVIVNGTVNNNALMDTDSPDGSGYLLINKDGVLNVEDNIIMVVCDGGELIVDGTLILSGYMEVYNAVSGSGSWINNGLVHFGVFTDEETGSESVGYSYFDGRFNQGAYGVLEVELYEGDPIYIDLLPAQLQQLVYFGNDMESIRTVFANEEYHDRVHIEGDAVLDGDLVVGTNGVLIVDGSLTIPENVTLTAYGPVTVRDTLNVEGTLKLYHPNGTLTVKEGCTASVTGTVFNGTSATVHGSLIIDGIWEGYAPTSSETGIITSSGAQEQLNALLEKEEATLTFDVTLTEDTTISGYLIIAEGVTLTVPGGITLTIDGIVDVYGALNVKSGASLVNNGVLCAYSTGEVACASSSCYSGDGAVQAVYENETLCAITNIPKSVQTLCVVDIDSEAYLQSAMDMVRTGGYMGGMLFPVEDITLTEDLTVLENVTVVINGPTDAEGNYGGDYIPISLTVSEDVFVSVEGGIEVGCEATMELDGSMAVHGYVYVAENGCMNLNGWCDNYNILVVFGTLNQNGGLGNTGGRVRIMDGSILNMAEDAYAWNFMAYGEDGGYFGTYENYPADKLYLHTYPQTTADIRTLMTEYQTGNYADGTVQIDPSSGYVSDFVIDEDVTVVEGAGIMVIDTEDMGGASLTVGENVTLTIENGAGVYVYNGCSLISNGVLTVSGDLNVNEGADITVNGCVTVDGCMKLNGWCDNYGSLTIQGTLNQNGGLGNTGGRVRLMDGSTLEMGERAYAWNFMAYGDEGGYFGTYENYPADKLYLHCYPDSAADIQTLVTEFQTGKYVDGTVQIDSFSGHSTDLVIDQDITLVDGTGIMILDSEGTGPSTLTIAENAYVTVENGAGIYVYDTCSLTVNGTLAVSGTLTVRDGGMLVNNLEVACDLGTITIADGCYTEGENAAMVMGFAYGGHGVIEGVPQNEQILVGYTCASQSEIQQVLDMAGDYRYVLVHLYEDVTIDSDLTIPENVTVRIRRHENEDGTIGNTTIHVTENATVTNNGWFEVYEDTCLIVDGSWLGNLPWGDGTIEGNIPMSQEELVARIEEAGPGGYIWLDRNVTITQDLTLDNVYLDVAEGVTLYVPAGVTLTINDTEDEYYSVLGTWGNIIVDGALVNNAELACEYSGTIIIAEGGYSGDGDVTNAYWSAEQKAAITGIPTEQQTLLVMMATSEEDIRGAIAKADTYGFVTILARHDITITGSLDIPENVVLRLYREWVDGEIIPANMTMEEDAFVTVYGTLLVSEHATLTVNGSLIVPGTLTVQDGGMLVNNLEVACDLGTITIADGCYTEGENAWMVMGFANGVRGVIEGVPQNEQILVGGCASQSEIQQVMDMAGDYRYVLVHLDEDMTIDSDLTIPENVTIWIRRQENEDGTIGKITVHVTENATVTNNGCFEVHEDTCLIVDGIWEGNAPDVYGELGGSFFVVTQEEFEELLASGDTWISVQGIVDLTATTVIPEGVTIELISSSRMTVPEGVELIVEGGLILMQDSVLTVNGTLRNQCYISVRDWATLNTEGGEYHHADWAVLENVHWGDSEGNVAHATILGIHAKYQYVIVNGGNEALIRELLNYATTFGAPYLEINIYDEVTLSSSLYLPEIANMTIENWEGGTANLIVPKGVTLYNEGRIGIRNNGILTVNGKFMGYLPALEHPNAQFIVNGEVDFDQNDLETMLAKSAEFGGNVCLSIPLTLTKDLVVPEGAYLQIVGSGAITVPAGRTLTNNGWIDVDNSGTLTAATGGIVKNNGGIGVMNDSLVDLSGGVYEHAEGAQVNLHFRNEGPGTAVGAELIGIPYEYVTIYQEGWDEAHLREIISMAEDWYPIQRLWISVTGEMTLTDDLTIPAFATAVIENVGYGSAILTVPTGMTLTNNGHIQIGNDAHVIVQPGGALEGNQPIVFVGTGSYVNSNFTEADLRSYIDDKAVTGGEVFLSTNITLTADLEIPENVIVVISKDGALWVPEGVTLTVRGEINTQMETGLFIDGGTVVNSGSIDNMHWGVTELISGEYINDGGFLRQVYNSTELGYLYNEETGELENASDAAFVRGDFAPEDLTIVGRGADESNIRMVLDLAESLAVDGEYPNVELWLTDGELFLSADLTIPEYCNLYIANQRMFGGTLMVPEGVTLTNNGYIHIFDEGWLGVLNSGVLANNGIIDIGWAGTLVIREGGIITGNHPFCYDTGSTYINQNTYEQAYLEALITEAQANGDNFAVLGVPVTLTTDMEIPEGFELYIIGRDNFITIPEDVTLYNYGSIYCHMFGGILGQGGWLHNNGDIRALNWGVVDMSGSWGNYSSDTGARIHNHHWIYSDGNEGRGTVMGFYPSDVIVHTEGDDDRVIHEMVDFIWNVGDNENGVWSELDSTVTGDMTLSQDLYWPFFGTMTIPEGVTVTVPAGVTLDITGTVILRGSLVIEEGAVVNTNYPICVDGGEILGNTDSILYYIPGTALEGFTVTTSAGDNEVSPGTAADIWADSWTPADAEVLAFYYEITSEDGWFTQNGARTVFGDPGQRVSVTADHGGEVTVNVYAVIGVDENGILYDDQIETVSVTFSGLAIGVMIKDAPGFIENAGTDHIIPGLWAGGKTTLYPILYDTYSGEELDAGAVEISYSEGYEQFAKIVNKANVLTITALTTLTQRETIDITFTAEGAAPETITVVLLPKLTTTGVYLNGENVSGQTVLADLNRGDTEFWLDFLAEPYESYPNTDTNAKGEKLVTWTSSNQNIATVDDDGHVTFTGAKTGKVKITLTVNCGAKKTAVVTFNVVELAQEIFSSESNAAVMVGGASGTYTAVDADGNALKSTAVKWYLSNEYGEAIDAHPYASITAAGKLTTKAVADETKVYLMAQVIGDEWSATLYEPVCVTLYPAVESIQILDVINDPINDMTLLYDVGLHGLTYQLSWKAAPYAESVQSVSWKSSKPAVADIDENGLITVAGENASGTVKFTLTVTALNGKKHTASFTMKFGIFTTDLDLAVTLPDGTVTGDLSRLIVYGGETLTFSGSCVPENVTTDGVVWSVLDKTYGAITAKGVLKTKAVNNPTVFTVVAESKDGYCATYIDVILLPKQVTVNGALMDALVIWNDDTYLTKSTLTMKAGDAMYLYANEDADVTWKSSNSNVASVDADGYLEARANGTVTITATANDGSKRTATFTLKVSKLSEYVEITTKKGEAFTVASGKSLDLVGTVTYSDSTTDKKVTWSVDDTSVATISSSGKLAAAKGLTKAATVRVYADANDGNSWNFVDVQIVPLTTAIEIFGPFGADGRNVDISNTTVTWDMLNGTSFNLNAVSYPFDAMQDVTWKSSSTKVATIDASGNVECLSSGTITVTATANDGSGKKATFKLTVKKTMGDLKLPETAFIGGGKTLTITKLDGYSIDPLATNQTLNWSMTYSDGSAVPTSVATLTKGVLKTKAVTEPVELYICAEATDGSGLADDCTVTVVPVIKGVELYNVNGEIVSKKTVSTPVNMGCTILPDTTNVAGFGYDDDSTMDEFVSPDQAWTITYSKSGLVEAQFDGQAITFYATDAAKAGNSVKITLKANDGSGKNAYFTLSFSEAQE